MNESVPLWIKYQKIVLFYIINSPKHKANHFTTLNPQTGRAKTRHGLTFYSLNASLRTFIF